MPLNLHAVYHPPYHDGVTFVNVFISILNYLVCAYKHRYMSHYFVCCGDGNYLKKNNTQQRLIEDNGVARALKTPGHTRLGLVCQSFNRFNTAFI